MSESRILIFTNTQGYPISILDCVPIYSISNECLLFFKNHSLGINFFEYHDSNGSQLMNRDIFSALYTLRIQ